MGVWRCFIGSRVSVIMRVAGCVSEEAFSVLDISCLVRAFLYCSREYMISWDILERLLLIVVFGSWCSDAAEVDISPFKLTSHCPSPEPLLVESYRVS